MSKKKSTSEIFKKAIVDNPVQTIALLFTLGSVVITITNAFILNQLAPLATNIDLLKPQIQATQEILNDREPLVQRYLVTESKVELLLDRLNRIENKLDRLIEMR